MVGVQNWLIYISYLMIEPRLFDEINQIFDSKTGNLSKLTSELCYKISFVNC